MTDSEKVPGRKICFDEMPRGQVRLDYHLSHGYQCSVVVGWVERVE